MSENREPLTMMNHKEKSATLALYEMEPGRNALNFILIGLAMTRGELSEQTDGIVRPEDIRQIGDGERPPTEAEWALIFPVLEWELMVALGLRSRE